MKKHNSLFFNKSVPRYLISSIRPKVARPGDAVQLSRRRRFERRFTTFRPSRASITTTSTNPFRTSRPFWQIKFQRRFSKLTFSFLASYFMLPVSNRLELGRLLSHNLSVCLSFVSHSLRIYSKPPTLGLPLSLSLSLSLSFSLCLSKQFSPSKLTLSLSPSHKLSFSLSLSFFLITLSFFSLLLIDYLSLPLFLSFLFLL